MLLKHVPRSGLVAIASTVALAACGGAEETQFSPEALPDPGPIHVHGLGVDPADGALYIATHTGLWQLQPGEADATRVADRYQDTMGFTVAGARHFLGSGHPDVQGLREENLPPLLGLIESRDGGRTWRSISLLGESDFHILRFAGERIYGFDATNVRLMLSQDGGKTWATQSLPGSTAEPLVDLVVDPNDPEHLIATSERGLFESEDAGKRWRALGGEVGLLAWPTQQRLYLLAFDGNVLASGDRGHSWERLGDVGAEPSALLAMNERELYAAVSHGVLLASTDGGASWSVRFQP